MRRRRFLKTLFTAGVGVVASPLLSSSLPVAPKMKLSSDAFFLGSAKPMVITREMLDRFLFIQRERYFRHVSWDE